MRRAALARFVIDQRLFGPRGVNLWSQKRPSSFPFCPSIHPKVSATSSASAYETEAAPPSCFAILSHTPRELAWFRSSHRSQAVAEAKSFVDGAARLPADGLRAPSPFFVIVVA